MIRTSPTVTVDRGKITLVFIVTVTINRCMRVKTKLPEREKQTMKLFKKLWALLFVCLFVYLFV